MIYDDIFVKLNTDEIGEYARSAEIAAIVQAPAERIAAKAGDGFVVEMHHGPTRVTARVYTDTVAAMLAEATHRTLTRALDAGRG